MERTNQLTQQTLNQLLSPHEPPCISIYQPTSRHHPGITGDPIRFKNLLRRVEDELKQKYKNRQVQPLMKELRALLDDRDFWNHQLDGLAIFRSGDSLSILRLPRAVPEIVTVADTFHTKPLVRILQTTGRYHILCISQSDVSLLEGDRDTLHAVELDNVPQSIGETNLYDIDRDRAHARPEASAIRHGQINDVEEEQDVVALDRFFRVVDKRISEDYSIPAGLPLILAAVTEYHDLFRKVSKNPNLVQEGIRLNPGALGLDRLRAEAWRIIEPYYHQRTRKLIDDFHVAMARQSAAEDVAQVAEAATHGRVAALLVDANKQIGGSVDSTGHVEFKDIKDPATDDLLDDTAEYVLKAGGQVLVIPHELMPTRTGVAAIYRY
jgi:hypothetical protein